MKQVQSDRFQMSLIEKYLKPQQQWEKPMTIKRSDAKNDVMFFVNTNPCLFDYRTHTDFDEAVQEAQRRAWTEGTDVHVMKTVSIARAPEQAKTVKVDTPS